MWKSIHKLFERAQRDYKKLQHNISSKDFYLSYFLAQQCIEKCFKVLIALKNLDFPKDHDIYRLYLIVKKIYENDKDIVLLDQYASLYQFLTELYEQERYGIYFDDEYSPQEIQEVSEIVHIVYEVTHNKIPHDL